MRPRAGIAIALGAALLGGCAELLPTTRVEVTSPWRSFDEARAAIEAIVPGRTTTAELRSAAIDPYSSANVQLLAYSDILLRFPVDGLRDATLDAGLARCLDAGKACSGYEVTTAETRRDRVGAFLTDALAFRRVVDISGWKFNAIILVVDDRVVYTLYGGQPRLAAREVSVQPLGPAQGLGERAGKYVVR